MVDDNMKKYESYKMNKQDEKAVQLFIDLGMPKNLAKTLLYVSQVDECRSIDIEQKTSLRQPEVSIAMQQLMEKGWIKKRDLKKKGKGRPVHIYKLTSPIGDIIKNFEKEKIREIDAVKKDLSQLKNLIEKR